MYSVPIPLSYLINESRVKDTIISSGWVEGFKSIFHSEERIRDIRRRNFVNKLESSRALPNLTLKHANFSEPEKLFHRRTDYAQESKFRQENSLSNVEPGISNESSSGNVDTIKKFDRHQGGINDLNIEDIELCTDTSPPVSGTRQQPEKGKFAAPVTRIATINENVPTTQEYQTFLKDFVIKNSNFKIFARKYLLQNLIRTFNNGNVEVQYNICLQYLNDFEECLEGQLMKRKSFDILSSLTNTWQLYQLREGDPGIKNFNTKGTFPNSVINCPLNAKDLKIQEKKHIVQLLLDNLRVDKHYMKYLQLLNESSINFQTCSTEEFCGKNQEGNTLVIENRSKDTKGKVKKSR